MEIDNKKRMEYYIHRLQNLNEKGDDIKLIIEDSFEIQEKEYDKNMNKKKNKKDMSLVPLFIILILFFNLIIYNMYSDDNTFIPFITFSISLYLLYKYVPLKYKKRFISDFEKNLKKIRDFFIREKNNSKLTKYVSISSEEEKNRLLKDDENNGNLMDSPLLHI